MKKLPIIIFVALLLIAKTSNLTLADNEKKEETHKINFEKTEIRKDNDDKQTSAPNKYFEREMTEKNEKEFRIMGQITTVNSSSFVIGSQTVNIDKSKVDEFKQVGDLKVGMYAIVSGDIVDGSFYAERIVVNNRDKIEEENEQETNLTPTPSVSVTPNATPSVSPSPSPSATPSPLLIQGLNSEQKAVVSQAIFSFENLLKLLKGLLNI